MKYSDGRKTILDILTFGALVFSILLSQHVEGILYWALLASTSVAYVWSLGRNVEYGINLVMDGLEEDEEE